MRVFIAITLPDDIRNNLFLLQEKLQHLPTQAGLPIRCKWVEKENFHLTVSFLGACTAEQIQAIHTKLVRQLTARPFEIQLGNILLLPDGKHPQVIAVDVLHGKVSLESLAHTVTKLVGGRFSSPHATLARVKHSLATPADVLQQMCFTQYPVGTVRVDSVSIVKSVLTAYGPKYSVLHNVPLKKA